MPLHAGSTDQQLTTEEKQQLQREARLVVDLLQNHHYSGRAFREIENKEMISRFLSELDPQMDILSADSVDQIHRRFDHTLKSVYLFRGDLQPAFEIFDQFIVQAKARMEWAQKRLDRGFDFTLDETYQPPEQPAPFKSKEAADHHWELLLKEWVLSECLRGREYNEAIAEVKRRYREMDRTIAGFDSLAVRERFFDAVIRSYDPHSGYFSSDSAREFELEMEKAVVGLGLDLKKENGRCVVAAVQSGGSADLNSEIAPGDVIEALGEGDGSWIEINGLRLREIVALMRGSAGTKLRIAYRPVGIDRRTETILERTRVVLGSERARGFVSELGETKEPLKRIGCIELPSFYAAGENGLVTSATRDVRELLQQMMSTHLDGLVLDLRNNPGGAVTEATALSELFLPRGLMMLSRDADGKIKEYNLREGKPAYTGPLVVLVSSLSASASEIFSGALKYHRRAIIAGSGPTFGKGSVQAYIELSKMQAKEVNDWGTLRLTTERFYLPDGQAIQRAGVSPHVLFPSSAAPGQIQREADLPGAFPEDSLPAPSGIVPTAAPTSAFSEALLIRLNEAASQDFKNLPEWELYRQEGKIWQQAFSRKARSLILDQRQKEWFEQQTILEELRRSRREIARQSRFITLPCETSEVRAALDLHETKLRAMVQAGGIPQQLMRQGSLLIETERGRLRKLQLDAIDFQNFSGDTKILAEAFAQGSGYKPQLSRVSSFLREASLLEHKTEENLLTAATKLSDGEIDRVTTRKGIEELLRRLTELDGDMLSERPGLDIQLRESLRLAVVWSQWNETEVRRENSAILK